LAHKNAPINNNAAGLRNSTLKVDRAEHWIARGAQPSDTVRSLLKKNKARVAAAPPVAGVVDPGE